jgi:hypothetical protein
MKISNIMHRDVQIIGPEESPERRGNNEKIGRRCVAGRCT